MQETKYTKSKFSDLSDLSKIIDLIKKSGFDPKKINDAPSLIYKTHIHPETKLLVGISGEMKVKVGDSIYKLEAGDELVIPGNTEHSGEVGSKGCTYFWSEKFLT
jgi:quercetin dioxygenase-like cupin family protein